MLEWYDKILITVDERFLKPFGGMLARQGWSSSISLVFRAWEASVLPLNYTRTRLHFTVFWVKLADYACGAVETYGKQVYYRVRGSSVINHRVNKVQDKIMGIFDFLKSIGKKEESTKKILSSPQSENSMPTIKPDKEVFECYDEVFKAMISDISGLSENEAKEILSIIKNCDGGFLNMGGYQSIVWEKYFKGRDWQWKEYEEWNHRFTHLGRFPSRFPRKDEFVPVTCEDALSQLKVTELKSLCVENQLTPPTKAKKNDFIELLKLIPNITDNPLVSVKIDELNNRFSYDIYALFMRTINFRGKNLYDLKRSNKIGMKKFEIFYVFEEDKEFVEMALKINPDALHPVFPSDMSMKQPVIEF